MRKETEKSRSVAAGATLKAAAGKVSAPTLVIFQDTSKGATKGDFYLSGKVMVIERTSIGQFKSFKAIEAGIPAPAVAGLEAAGLTRADILTIIPTRTLERRLAEGDVLRVDEADGLARLLRTVEAARRVFGDDGRADRFLRTPHPAFDDQAPIRVARTDVGAREVETLLGRIEYGVYG